METASEVGGSLFSPNSGEKCAQKVTGPGIVVFSRTIQVLHVNRRALELAGRIGQVEVGSVRSLLSTAVFGLYVQVLEALNSRIAASIWDPFEVRRVGGEPGRRVLLRGYGLPDRNSSDCSRVVIILEEDLSVQVNVTEQAEQPLHLANVEKAVA
ncbi:MAG: hypothetical protein ACREI2_11100 [Nitrospiraceae bacterium]